MAKLPSYTDLCFDSTGLEGASSLQAIFGMMTMYHGVDTGFYRERKAEPPLNKTWEFP